MIDASAGPAVCRIMGGVDYLGGSPSWSEIPQPENVRRILVLRPGGIGDMILLLPTLNLLINHFPHAKMDILCDNDSAGIMRLAQLDAEVLPYNTRPAAVVFHIVRNRYDLAIDTEQFHHFSAILARLSGAPSRIGFKINPRRNPLYSHLINYDPSGPEPLEFARLLKPLKIEPPVHAIAGFLKNIDVSLPGGMEKALDDCSGAEGFAALQPESRSRHKNWAADRFPDLIKRLRDRHGLGTALIGDRSNRIVCDSIIKRVKPETDRIISCAGILDLNQTAMVIKKAKLFIGPDSAPAHLAKAAGVPSVTLFGPSDHIKWGMRTTRHAIVRKEMPCSPCFIFGYRKPCRNAECMKSITVTDVWNAVEEILVSDRFQIPADPE